MNRSKAVQLVVASLLLLLPTASRAAEEQAVLVYLSLSAPLSASKAELTGLLKLEEQVALAIERAHVGEHDGNEIGGGEFTIYCYGPNGDRLFAAIEPVLRASALAKGARVVIRYGKPGSKQVERLL